MVTEEPVGLVYGLQRGLNQHTPPPCSINHHHDSKNFLKIPGPIFSWPLTNQLWLVSFLRNYLSPRACRCKNHVQQCSCRNDFSSWRSKSLLRLEGRHPRLSNVSCTRSLGILCFISATAPWSIDEFVLLSFLGHARSSAQGILDSATECSN